MIKQINIAMQAIAECGYAVVDALIVDKVRTHLWHTDADYKISKCGDNQYKVVIV